MGKCSKSIRHGRIKAAIASILVFGGAVVAVGQGEVIFGNFGGGVNAPVFDSHGNPLIGPSPYIADLFWSLDTNSVADNLIPAGHYTGFNSNYPGYFAGGVVTLPTGQLRVLVVAQVRVWETNN